MLYFFQYATPRKPLKKGVNTMEDLEVIFLNKIDVDMLNDDICLEILKTIEELQNEDNQ